jgi:membrane-associated phospholipid phosphatase
MTKDHDVETGGEQSAATPASADLKTAAEALEKADVALGSRLASEREKPAIRVAGKAGKIGDQEPLYALGALLLVCGVVTRRERWAKLGVTLLAGVAVADAGKTLTKRLVKRTRPHVLLDEGRYRTGKDGSEDKDEQSFPSGHVAGSVAAARAVTRIFPEATPWPALAAAAIGVTRVLKGSHWPLDVAAGAFIGLAAEAVTSFFLELIWGKKPLRSLRRRLISRRGISELEPNGS